MHTICSLLTYWYSSQAALANKFAPVERKDDVISVQYKTIQNFNPSALKVALVANKIRVPITMIGLGKFWYVGTAYGGSSLTRGGCKGIQLHCVS